MIQSQRVIAFHQKQRIVVSQNRKDKTALHQFCHAFDVFYIKVLHHTFAYQVDQILTVEPSDTEALQIEKGKDYVTLVTCTPFAINTHRLLVRGIRIPYKEAKKVDNEIGLHRTIPFYMIVLIGGIIAVIVIWIIIKVHSRRKENAHEKEE